MGNSPSKSSSAKLSTSQPPFTRTDTSNSAKSGRSIRSRKSNRDNDDLNNTSPILSRKSSSKSVNNLINEFQNTQLNDTNNENNDNNIIHDHHHHHHHHNNNNNDQIDESDNKELPLSMIQILPREPILMRNNSGLDNNDLPNLTIPQQQQQQQLSTTPITPTSASFKSVTSYGTPISPVELKQELKSPSPLLSRIPTNQQQQPTQPSQPIQREINIEDVIQRLLDAGYSGKRTKNVCLKNSEIATICATAREIFLSQPTLLELSPPVKIVGDVHGQFNDLIRIFSKCGFPPLANYLFLGDYVDRGKQSLETILLLLCYKIKYPENFFLLRGNHECAGVTRVYGFLDECKRRCNTKTWKCFIDTFNTLPILAIVASKIFCVHGGLSPVLSSMDEIRRIQRPTDIPDFGLLNDLVWSDPADSVNEWEDNERGVSYCFNRVAINKFLNKFQFELVVRAHMVVEDGYEFFNEKSLVTVFSAPNYCGEFDNWGAVMSVNNELLCSFELLDPLDSAALKQVMKKGRMERSLYM